jgi:hypothetical protein
MFDLEMNCPNLHATTTMTVQQQTVLTNCQMDEQIIFSCQKLRLLPPIFWDDCNVQQIPISRNKLFTHGDSL